MSETVAKYAPGPYQTQEVGCRASFHAYVIDANGRKIGVAWGPVAEKVWTQALFAASFDMLALLQRTFQSAKLPPKLEADISALLQSVTAPGALSTSQSRTDG